MSGARASLSDWPDRHFINTYWTMPAGPTVYAYVSTDQQPVMVAIDLYDAARDPKMATVVAHMRAGNAPFREVREIRAAQHGRFLVGEV